MVKRISLWLVITFFCKTAIAVEINPVASVKDMSDAHVNWAIQESTKQMGVNPKAAYLMLEYYLLHSEAERNKVKKHIRSNPQLLIGGLESFSPMELHDTYKKSGFNKDIAKEMVRVRLSLFKIVATQSQLNKAIKEYKKYFYKGDEVHFIKLDDIAVLETKIKKFIYNAKNEAKVRREKELHKPEKVEKIELGDFRYSKWYGYIEKDGFSDKTKAGALVIGKKVFADYSSVGIRCSMGKVALTFDTVKFMDFSGRKVSIKLRVDKNPTRYFDGYLYTNSNHSGILENELSDNLVLEMKKGSKILLEISNEKRSNIYQYKFSLSGFTKTYNKIWSNCK